MKQRAHRAIFIGRFGLEGGVCYVCVLCVGLLRTTRLHAAELACWRVSRFTVVSPCMCVFVCFLFCTISLHKFYHRTGFRFAFCLH